MADNPALRGRMGAAGRAQAVRRWDRRLLAADFVHAAERAVGMVPIAEASLVAA
jgi:hypothetical protein